MNEKLFITFCILNIANVIIQTVKSIATIKCKKTMAAIINAIAYGLYTVVVVYMVCELPLWLKVAVIAIANLIGVYIVKLFEEKGQKDKLWKIEVTIPTKYKYVVDTAFKRIPHNYIEISNKHTLFSFYCESQEQSRAVRELVQQYDAKYFVSETKNL